ncbi:hypothetical protein HZS_6455 [Henneguya salminicola]|nr:hypothetical protein HZS_6455 [Henneguya salminicola]
MFVRDEIFCSIHKSLKYNKSSEGYNINKTTLIVLLINTTGEVIGRFAKIIGYILQIDKNNKN